jgi:DSF synthase
MSNYTLDNIYDPRFFKELDIDFDHEEGILWLFMKPHGRGCFTTGLLRELKRYQHGLMKWQGMYVNKGKIYSVDYQVLASGLDGIYNYGGDLNLFLRSISERDAKSLLNYGVACIDVVYPSANNYDLPITTISLVEGAALGGGLEAVLSSDIIIAEKGAQLGFPEIMFNLFPGMGAYQLLARRVAPNIVKKIISSGCVYTAEEFYDMGIVDILTDKGEGKDAVADFVRKHKRHKNGHDAIDKITNLNFPVTYEILYKVVEIWVEAALKLTKKDLKIMERLSKAQANVKESTESSSIGVDHRR